MALEPLKEAIKSGGVSQNTVTPEPAPKTAAIGLTQKKAEELLRQHGANRLPEPPMPSSIQIFFRQFLSPFIYILVIASVVSFLLGQNPSGIFIIVVLLLNAAIGTIQEYSAQQSAAALRNLVKGVTHVVRDGIARTIDVEELVPGDLVLLSSGDKVPADVLLLSSQNLAVDESMLTGESLAVSKNFHAEVDDDAPLSERVNQCFAGSIITHGRAQAIVTATATNTEIGRIARHVTQERVSEPPLMIRIRSFTYQVAGGIFVAILVLTIMMLLKGGYDTEAILLMTIGLAVSVIPEGLPAALTVALAIGMRRMAKNSVIIRKLVAVESLGSCTFICSDKTGTLTVNELTIRQVVLPDNKVFRVTGEGISPGGEVCGDTEQQHLQQLCIAGVLANESHLSYAGGEWVSDGDIVDVAFLVLAKKLGLSITQLREQQTQLDLIPYEPEKAYCGSLNQDGETAWLYAKGSPEKMLSMCNRMETLHGPVDIDTALIEQQFESLAQQGYRIIALAKREVVENSHTRLEQMNFLGMVAMIDPLRKEAFDAITRCREGGIEVAMVTGDHPSTAKSIAMELGLCEQHDAVVTGDMIHRASAQGPKKADELIRPIRVFARIEPQQKEQIVDSFMRQGHFVAVTGDGVNDAPAMRQANTGIAMGRRGTDVAKETADLIITDDNFASIVSGIEQGRVVYNNIRKVIALLVATGFSALWLFFLSVVAGLPMPMVAVQLLWLNLIANGLQDVALAFEPKEGHELTSKPRNPSEPIFEKMIIEHVVISGTVMGGLAFIHYYLALDAGQSVEQARNLTLMLMVLFGNIHALNSRSETQSLFSLSLFANPFLMLAVPIAQLVHIAAMYTPGISDVLAIQPISLAQWSQLLIIACSLLVVEELHKWWRRRH
ncbi:HAD-IC family P-type ATPase [Photobacterium sp. SDRW27]|uniref:cation-translocating P-type ATPase n=1 Tax=Photobacterium obscurum TaxID=2829490 RepID=UPI002244E5BF|nr:HAD-IC family P-type ATPase [Photobacterium obscurum]MCW8328704.1 HAD-IC family P-type ATPase [Photobacterium obscurum]